MFVLVAVLRVVLIVLLFAALRVVTMDVMSGVIVGIRAVLLSVPSGTCSPSQWHWVREQISWRADGLCRRRSQRYQATRQHSIASTGLVLP